jgi:hypothetical protein
MEMREKLVDRGESTAAIDQRINVERIRVMRSELDRPGTPARAATLEITASRKAPQEQAARIIQGDQGKAAGKKTATGTSKAKGKAGGSP